MEILCRQRHGFDSRDFTGPEHIQIQKAIKLDNILPGHPKLDDIKRLWGDFAVIMSLVKGRDIFTDYNRWSSRECKEWVKLFTTVYLAKDLTPYMHALVYHVPEALRIHGNLDIFSHQGMEKTNDSVSATNHHNTTALKQVLAKRSTIDFLSVSCQRNLHFSVSCSIWSKKGHNERICNRYSISKTCTAK